MLSEFTGSKWQPLCKVEILSLEPEAFRVRVKKRLSLSIHPSYIDSQQKNSEHTFLGVVIAREE